MSNHLSHLLDAISHLHIGRPIIGIDGLSRSGKTTLAGAVQGALLRQGRDVRVFHIDAHIVDRRNRYGTGRESWYEHYFLQWDVGYLKENLFAAVRDRDAIELLFYDAERDAQVAKRVSLPEECVIVIEGVFLQRPEWRETFDVVAYLDCPRETLIRVCEYSGSVLVEGAISPFVPRVSPGS